MSTFQITFASPALEKRGRNSPLPLTILEPHPSSSYVFPVSSLAPDRRFSSPSLSSSGSEIPPPSNPVELQENLCRAIDSSKYPTLKLQLIRYLWSGKLWDFWDCSHSQFGKVCLKIVNTQIPPPSHFEEVNDLNGDDPFDVLPEALKEEKIYEHLSTVQGSLVPKYYGIYHHCTLPIESDSDQEFLAILLEFSGESIGPCCIRATNEFRLTMNIAYKQFHLLGIYHGDISGKQILISRNYNDELVVRLVGFRKSYIVNLENRDDVCDLVTEAGYVRTFIGGQKLEEINIDVGVLVEVGRWGGG